MINIALTAEPNNPSFLDTYGWIQFKLGNTDKAIEYINKAIKIGDVSAEVFEHLGDIYNTLGDKIEAEKNWRKGLEIEPDNSNLKKRLNID
jgi:tetratricopeptide (TPR) repeat protein